MNTVADTGSRTDLEESATATASDFDRIEKRTLQDRRGTSFRDYKNTLKPRYFIVWRSLLPGHLMLAATLCGVSWAQAALPLPAAAATAAAGALLIGYALAYIELFFHEAAHYNIAPGRALNDALANLFLGALIGQDIAQYRAIHFDHHRYLGTTRDTERSYFDPLTPGFILQSLTGIRVLKVILIRQRAGKATPASAAAQPKQSMFNRQLIFGVLLHAALLGTLLGFRQWGAAAAWAAGVAVVFPFFGAVRQVLEHRSEMARPDVDYSLTDHGAVNRMFGAGPLASTLGGAGFNRHLLHHWEPQISCTRLRELERFLLDTPAADALRAHQTTYLRTFAALLKSNVRRPG
jgi:fatty acid desaturase